MDVHAVSGRTVAGLVEGKNLELEIKFIDWNGVFASIILSSAGQESLSEEKTGNPKHVGLSEVEPILQNKTGGTEAIMAFYYCSFLSVSLCCIC